MTRFLRASTTVACALVIGAFIAFPASAYVVVTSDNQVFEVPTRPEMRADMVLFTLDGMPVSLRVQDVNIPKTNEFNYMLDTGASPVAVARQIRALPPARPEDERLVVSHPLQLKRVTDAPPDAPDYRVMDRDVDRHPSFRDDDQDRMAPDRDEDWDWPSSGPSFDDQPGRPTAADDATSRSRFAEEARRAYDEASEDVRRDDQPRQASRADRVADIEAELASEQEYLRRLTSGEAVVDDLDREIDKSLEKIRQLQDERDAAMAMGETPDWQGPEWKYEPSGRFPAGSREAKWEQELAELKHRKAQYEERQAALPAGSSREREALDEQIGELEHRIGRLEDKLAEAVGR